LLFGKVCVAIKKASFEIICIRAIKNAVNELFFSWFVYKECF
jgi:hypothetical protein